MSLTTRVMLGMVLGILLGGTLNLFSLVSEGGWLDVWLINGVVDAGGKIFIASLKLMVVPIVFFSLVCGAASMGMNAKMGKMAIHTLFLYLFTTFIAVSLAVVIANVIDPGEGANLGTYTQFEGKSAPALKDVIIGMFPTNPIAAMAAGNMLQVIVFCILFGLAISVAGEAGQRVLRPMQDLNEVVLKMIMMIINLAPYGVFFLLTKLFANLGFSKIADLALYFFTVVFVLLLHALVVYPLILKFFSGLSPLQFLKNIRPAALFAFSTSSSAASIPVTLSVVEQRLGVDNRISSFTIPLGATINMDGTAILQGVATVFIAQAFNIDLSIGQYLMVIVTATLASIGTAAVPSAGLVMLTIVFSQVGLPVEAIGIIFAVDRLLDMLRTAVNVTGDAMVTTVIAKRNDMFDQHIFDSNADLLASEAK